MNIFIDTAVKGCNVALFDDKQILSIQSEPIERGHAEAILPLFEKALDESKKSKDDIEAIYVTVGPGSFTGLRVGLTTAQFMGFSLDKPVHGISTFQAFSCGIESDKDRLVLVETKRDDYYAQLMNKNHQPQGDAKCMRDITVPDDTILTGDAVPRFCKDNSFDGEAIPQQSINIQNTLNAIQSGVITALPAEGFYIREADVSQPKATTR